MRSLVPLLVLAVAALVALPALPPGKQKAKGKAENKNKVLTSPYYPLEDGTRWVYKVGERTITARVVRHEPLGGVPCARVEAGAGGELHVEHIAVRPDGVYRYRADGKDIEPPLCFLRLPPKAGATWKADSKIDALEMTATFVLGAAEVSVPAGKYRAVMVTSADFVVAGRKTPVTTWFAAGVGPVRQRVEISGTEVVLELQSFVAPK
jgi:hypothetical protein